MNAARAHVVVVALAKAGVASGEALRIEAESSSAFNRTARVTAGTTTLFAKWNDRGLEGHFAGEAEGLKCLHAAASGLSVPRPLAWNDEPADQAFLVMDLVESGTRPRRFDDALGQGLARLHRASSRKGFGFACDTYCGASRQKNDWYTDWVDFFRDQRLASQVEVARRRGLSRVEAALCDRLMARLEEWIADDEPPALLHGDLWSGNLLCNARGEPTLIDPAAYYGHREAEFGMTTLFGGFSRRVYDAYHEAHPLRPGWQERVDLYALYHLLNHFNLFGGSYGREAMAIVKRFVG